MEVVSSPVIKTRDYLVKKVVQWPLAKPDPEPPSATI
jgi:hypothetical protein